MKKFDFEIVKTDIKPLDRFQCYCGILFGYTDLPDTREFQYPKCCLFWKVVDDGVNRFIEEVI